MDRSAFPRVLRIAARRRRDGAVVLEALFSIMLLMALALCAWVVSMLVVNKAILSTAVELSAQQALVVYDREIYYQGNAGSKFAAAAAQATADAATAAAAVMNAEAGNLVASDNTNGFSPQPLFDPDNVTATVTCASSFTGTFGPCNGGAPVEKMTVTVTNVTWTGEILLFGDDGLGRSAFLAGLPALSATGTAYSTLGGPSS